MPRPKLTFILSAQARRDARDTPGLHQLLEAVVNREDILATIQGEAAVEVVRQRVDNKPPSRGMPDIRVTYQDSKQKGGNK